MCTNPADFQSEENAQSYTYQQVVERAKRLGERLRNTKENINLTGGEPTIHPRFLELLGWFRKQFPGNKLVLATNGRMFNYPWFAKKVLEFDNLAIEVAILGPNKKLHEALTRTKGSFGQTTGGILNILKYRNSSQELELRIIITKVNFKRLDKIINFIKKEFSAADRLVLVFPEVEGSAGKNFKMVGLTYKELKPYFSLSLMGKWKKGLTEIRLYHFPLCVIDPGLWQYAWRTLREDEISFLPGCSKCLYKKYCLGIHKDYLKLIGDGEFKPIKKRLNIKVQNFFHHPIVAVKKTPQRRL